ncbi:MAG TPA: TraB/GumN family protein, partial [Luteimonas sp.]|nr:TraB/GumN family protein [Luteimonas sp.]
MRLHAISRVALVLAMHAASSVAFAVAVPAPVPRAASTTEAPVPPVAQPPSAIVDMETMVVTGAQPGPGLWRVHRDGHVLYILGTLSPLPRRMEWIPDTVEATIASSQAVIDPPSIKLDAGVGRVRGLLLLPSLL